ncbi:hypothetical protein [Dactylosporangium sp. CA-233914]|uniref:hypothetical protein n=1 Tax=Dactylosporangium sp. CA-233914 TaxID=3239934 RepID=UPI003D919AD8
MGYAGRRPQRQVDAMRAASGADADASPEPFLVSLAALNILVEAAADRPVAVLADDVRWLDPQTHDTLSFLARRVTMDPVVIVGPCHRPDPAPQDPLADRTRLPRPQDRPRASTPSKADPGPAGTAEHLFITMPRLDSCPRPGPAHALPPNTGMRHCWNAAGQRRTATA